MHARTSPLALVALAILLVGCPPQTQLEPAPLDSAGAAAPPGEGPAAEPAPEPRALIRWTGKPAPDWKQVDQLVEEQKLEAAAAEAEKLLEAARAARDSEAEVLAMMKIVELRTGLHGYETTVRFLREQPWPEDLLGRTATALYYAQSLTHYAQAYSWEVNKREKVESKGAVDLKAWTREQIYEEAVRAYAEVWGLRAQLGELPSGSLGSLLAANTFPEGIRPTLRDALTYLLVDLLADTNGWRPEHNNEVFRLDLDKHLAADAGLWPRGVSPAFLADPTVHPITRMAGALADLEGWHAQRGAPEAALEAALQRAQQLHARFSQEADRAQVRAMLEARLKGLEARPWWAAGMAALAEMVRQEPAPDALVRARELAARGREAFPDSLGGQRCRAIVEGIEAPAYRLEGMAVDAPQKRSLAVHHRNLPAVWFRAYPVDIVAFLETADDWDLYPRYDELEKIFKKTRPAKAWQVELPATPDFRDHRTYVVPPLDKPGFYVVVASAREGFPRSDNVMTGIYFQVSDLVLSVRHDRGGAEVMAQSGQSGKPLEGVDVQVYKRDYRRKHHVVASQRTDARGVARLPVLGHDSFFLVARHQGQLTVDRRYLSLWRAQDARAATNTFLFTDRSVYRPLQTLHWKAIAYTGSRQRADWRTLPRQAVSVSLVDPNNQVVESKTATTNEYGTASGEFAIPAGRVLGQWSLRASPQGHAQVRVEEYKRPTFEAKFLESKEPLRLNKPARMRGEARYYFGLPVTDGKALWRVTRTPVYPWWWYEWGWAADGQGQVVATGVAGLRPDGTFEVEFTPEADERLAAASRELSYRYLVSADVTDEGGETRSASKAYRLGFVAVEASLRLDTGFLLADRPAEAVLTRRDLDGAPAPGKGSFRLLALEGPDEARLPADQPLTPAPGADRPGAHRTEGDGLRPRWSPGYNPRAVLRAWRDGAERARGELAHDDKGEAKLGLPALPAGAYRLRYETEDAFGAKYEMSQELLVAGPRAPLALPALMLVEKGSLGVGEKARVWALSGLKGQPMVLDLHREQKLLERRILDSDRDAQLIEIPITEALRGGFGVSLHVLRDHQAMEQSASVFVPWDTQELKLEFATFRDKLRPGARETWTVKVTDASGKRPVARAAELLAYMYDKSLDIFAPHNPPRPIGLFPHRGSPVVAQPHLGAGPQAWLRSDGFRPRAAYPSVLNDRLAFTHGYGVGGPGHRGPRFAKAQRLMRSEDGAPPPAAPSAEPRELAADEEAPSGSAGLKGKAEAKRDVSGATASLERDGRDDDKSAAGEAPAPAVEMRTNFSETAFFLPHLVAGEDGTAALEFQVPDSVTAWNVWVHGVTADLRSGSLHEETRSVKDLMVRPYLPRFLREGDRAVVKVVVNNASDKPLEGKLSLEVLDPDSERSLLAEFGLKPADARDRPFQVEPGGGADLSFELTTPARVGPIAIKVVATSGDLSDGELRPLPVLPGRMHLAQSRFATLKDKARRELHFADMARDDDPSLIHESLVVTLDAQLFYSVLSALPYLVNYPYECTEQTLNRFLSTGIVSSMFKRYPAIERMAQKFSERKTRLEEWAAPDPNRKMALEETPWLQEAKGGADTGHELINVLDSRIARAHRDDALAKLKKAQTGSGGFPWFPGGPPDDWMTLYLLYGFSKAIEFQVDVPKDVTRRAWAYLHRHYIDEIVRDMRAHDCCWEAVTFLNYVLSNYPDTSWSNDVFTDAERKEMLAHSFKHWRQHSPYLKGYLALTLKRMGRPEDARLVWESVMDSAKTAEDQGTFWAPEDRGWLWYNDTIETHAFAVRTVMELTPEEPKLDGLVLWLFLHKKLGHWKSTRATAEVIYSLLHYLKKTEQLGTREAATVTVGPEKHEFTFEPDEYTGKKNQIVVPGEKLDAKAHSTVVVEKDTRGFMFASATWHFSTEKMPTEDRGDFLQVSRVFFKREKQGREVKLRPLAEGEALAPGDEVEVQLSIRAKHPVDYVHLRDPRGAGFEPVSQISRHRWDLGLYYYEEVRDSGQNFFFARLPQGEYTFKYRLRAALAGTYKVAPATLQPMYAPEFNAYSAGHLLSITPAD